MDALDLPMHSRVKLRKPLDSSTQQTQHNRHPLLHATQTHPDLVDRILHFRRRWRHATGCVHLCERATRVRRNGDRHGDWQCSCVVVAGAVLVLVLVLGAGPVLVLELLVVVLVLLCPSTLETPA